MKVLSLEPDMTSDTNVYSFIVDKIINSVFNNSAGFNYTRFSSDMSRNLAHAYSNCNRPGLRRLLETASRRIGELYEAARNYLDLTLLLELTTSSRLLVHTKAPFMPLEVGLAWHPYLNLPYIPSSTIKGAIGSHMGELSSSELCGVRPEELLGMIEYMGRLVITDALPVRCQNSLLDADVVTPHYPEVRGIIDEARVNPTPIVFLSVSSGVVFNLVVGVKGSLAEKAQCLARALPEILARSLEEGLGAKTSIGYGILQLRLVNRRVVSRD